MSAPNSRQSDPRNTHIASFSLETPVLVAWLTTPLSCITGSTSGPRASSERVSSATVSVIGWGLLVARALPAGAHGRQLAVAVAVTTVPVVVPVVVPAGPVVVVGLGVVGRLVAPAERRQHEQHAAEGRQAQ